MARLSTHVLDTARGVPAADLRIDLHRVDTTGRTHVTTTTTNADGRTTEPLMAGESMPTGVYELTFHAGRYLRDRGVAPRGPAVPRRDRDSLRHRVADRRLPRAAAAVALRVQHLSGLLNARPYLEAARARDRPLSLDRGADRGRGPHHADVPVAADARGPRAPRRVDGVARHVGARRRGRQSAGHDRRRPHRDHRLAPRHGARRGRLRRRARRGDRHQPGAAAGRPIAAGPASR